MHTIKLIVGLANPGLQYAKTRHNAGAWYIHILLQKHNKYLKKESKFYGYTTYLNIGGVNVHLLVPSEFMNMNGKAVVTIANYYNINSKEILVAHDELDFPPGVAKFKLGGGHAGHNGLKDIINKLGNNTQFYRLRIGIGHPGDKNKVVNFVLNKPNREEQNLIDTALHEAACCTELWFQKNWIHAMNRLHSYKSCSV